MAKVQLRLSRASLSIAERVLSFLRSVYPAVTLPPIAVSNARTLVLVLLLSITMIVIQLIHNLFDGTMLLVAANLTALVVILGAAHLAAVGKWVAALVVSGVVTLLLVGGRLLASAVLGIEFADPFGLNTYFIVQPMFLLGMGVLSPVLWPVILIDAVALVLSVAMGTQMLSAGQWPHGGYLIVTAFWGFPVLLGLLLHRTQRTFQRLVRQQDLFLRESHHRSKNQIAMLSSLINLHPDTGSIEDLKATLIARLRAMADVQQHLQESAEYGTVALRPFLEQLVRDSLETVFLGQKDIRVSVHADPISIPGAWAPKIGILLVELLLNAEHHAFVGRTKGSVSITMQQEQGVIRFRYRDDGVGLPEGFDPDAYDTLGVNLIRDIAGDLNAELSLQSTDGVSLSLVFPRPADRR